MLTLLTLSVALAAPFSRDSQGVADAVGGLLPAFQACLAEAEPGGASLLRLRFTIDETGAPGPVEALPAEADGALADCLRGPVSALRFQEGGARVPVEIPVRVQIEERRAVRAEPRAASAAE